MQGRPGQGHDSWNQGDQYEDQSQLNGTGKRRAYTRRSLPEEDYVEQEPPRRRRQRRNPVLVVFLSVLAVAACGICTFMAIYGGTNLIRGFGVSSGPSIIGANFMNALITQDYSGAYADLGPPLNSGATAQGDFLQRAQQADRCFGRVTDYKVVPNSTTAVDNTTWKIGYNVTRGNLQKPYQLTLTLKQGSDGNWKVVSYVNASQGTELGPQTATCS